ncbi:MAG: hypothetical protein LQ351_004450 [Letrouitia transgressa]|nr:MAG: hypothetical protein LQ351_004450 [Letrouitia transgressa]
MVQRNINPDLLEARQKKELKKVQEQKQKQRKQNRERYEKNIEFSQQRTTRYLISDEEDDEDDGNILHRFPKIRGRFEDVNIADYIVYRLTM